jgi:DnaK suppressor protein
MKTSTQKRPARRRRPRLTAEFRQRLAAMRWALARTVATTDEELATLEAQQPGDFGEGASTGAIGDLLARLDGRERHELDEIDAAQRRLETGLFGVCERCHQAIPLARLRAVPTALRCARCQGRLEAAH